MQHVTDKNIGSDSNNIFGILRDVLLVALALAAISYFHYWPLHLDFMSHDTFHILLRRLYYIPVLYAAFRFGVKGGLLASLTATLLFAPHAAASMGGFGGGSVDNSFDILGFNLAALITGSLVEARRRQARRYQEILGLNREIEDRETDIRSMKSYTDSILSSVGSGVVSTDRGGRVVTVNPAACRILGAGEDDIKGFPLKKIFPGQDELCRAVEAVLSGARRRATLEAGRPTDRGRLTIAVRISPLKSRGEIAGVVVTLEDLAEVKDLTEQLLRADKLSNLGELVAGVAHEVRNPLGVIKASVQMMEQEMAPGCQTAELTRVMAQEIDRLDSLVNALLDFGRPSESQFAAVSMPQLLNEVLLLTKQFARQQQVRVSHECAPDLPPVWAAEDRLKQVFVNLISNAVQAMPDGGDLAVSAAVQEGYLRVAVQDTGVGISAGEQERIFDPFHTTRAEGSGLGLSIVHRIVDAHDGFITIDSRPGEGACFTVSLPLDRSAQAAPRTGAEPVPALEEAADA